MKFLKLHQKKKPVLIKVDSIKQILVGNKGVGAILLTDMDIYNLEVDESQDTIVEYLSDMEIEVELVSNDI